MKKSEFEDKLDVVFCRKCNVPMKKSVAKIPTTDGKIGEWPYHCIPRVSASENPIAEMNVFLPVEVYVCIKCRLIEMYSAGRGGAES